jgi:DNA polymerase
MSALTMTNVEALDTIADFLEGGYHRPHVAPAQEEVQFREAETAHPGGDIPEAVDSLDKIASDIAVCKRCRLCQGRRNSVPGEGCAVPLVLVIGEGPGAEEDAQGRPFVGPAGQLLDKMLASVGLFRERNCYIVNAVKCRPPGNRTPQADEMSLCRTFLERQIAILEPPLILCMGNTAIHDLLNTPEGVTRLHGRWTKAEIGGRKIPLMPSFHPSALLRDASYKGPAFQDLKALAARLVGLNKTYASQALPLLRRYAVKDKTLAAALPPDYT